MIPNQALKCGIEKFTHRIYAQGKIKKKKLFDSLAIYLHAASTLPHCLVSFVQFFAQSKRFPSSVPAPRPLTTTWHSPDTSPSGSANVNGLSSLSSGCVGDPSPIIGSIPIPPQIETHRWTRRTPRHPRHCCRHRRRHRLGGHCAQVRHQPRCLCLRRPCPVSPARR